MNALFYLINENNNYTLLLKDIEKDFKISEFHNLLNDIFNNFVKDKLLDFNNISNEYKILENKNYIKNINIDEKVKDIPLFNIKLDKLDDKETLIVYLNSLEKEKIIKTAFLESPLIYFLENNEYLEISKLYDIRTLFENVKPSFELLNIYYDYYDLNNLSIDEDEILLFENFLDLYNDNEYFFNSIEKLDFKFFEIVDLIANQLHINNDYLEEIIINIYNKDYVFTKKQLKYKDRILNILSEKKFYNHIIYNYNILEIYITFYGDTYLTSLEF